MKRSTLLGSGAVWIFLGLTGPLFAAPLPPTVAARRLALAVATGSTAKSAEKCLGDLRAFDSRMETDGFWRSVYPIGGYEVRGLVASVNVLAQHGEQQLCEDTLSTTRESTNATWPICPAGRVLTPDPPAWQRQIGTASRLSDHHPSVGVERKRSLRG